MDISPQLPGLLDAVAGTFNGQLLQPGDAAYDDVRKVHNGLIDKRPAVIARCRGVGDVADAVKLARDTGLDIAVRGGGHNVAGRSAIDNGLMIDLSLMTGIHVDPAQRVARAQGGATWNLFNRETQVHGLATTGGVISTTGIGGLTLGGGIGWLMSKHALALDNLLAVDLVLADGTAVTASEDQNSDLFWAVRGGGGNFGVATSLQYRLHPVGPNVTGGIVAYPVSEAWDVLRYFRDLTASLPDDLMAFAGLLCSPDGTPIVAIVAGHFGSPEAGERALAPVKNFGTPALDTIGTISYTGINTMLDHAFPKGALNYWKSNFLSALSDDAIRALIECYKTCPSPMSSLLLEHFHGAVTRIAPMDTAFPHRSEGYNLLVLSQWMDPKDNDACIAWAKQSYSAMSPFVGRSRYVNYLGDDEAQDAVADAYGPNYERLLMLKAKYDPDNVFRMNQNIRAATSAS